MPAETGAVFNSLYNVISCEEIIGKAIRFTADYEGESRTWAFYGTTFITLRMYNSDYEQGEDL